MCQLHHYSSRRTQILSWPPAARWGKGGAERHSPGESQRQVGGRHAMTAGLLWAWRAASPWLTHPSGLGFTLMAPVWHLVFITLSRKKNPGGRRGDLEKPHVFQLFNSSGYSKIQRLPMCKGPWPWGTLTLLVESIPAEIYSRSVWKFTTSVPPAPLGKLCVSLVKVTARANREKILRKKAKT